MAFRIPFDHGFWGEYLNGQEASLPYLRPVENITDRVIRVLGANPGSMQLQGTNTYLVGTGKSRILIDTGEGAPSWIEHMVHVLQRRNIDISHILLTHWHGDHTGGVPDLIAYNRSWASRVYKNTPDYGQHGIENGQVFRVEGATLRAVFSPGHAIDHMCFVLEEENALFTGDNVLGHGYSVVQDLGVYMQSLEYMAAQFCTSGYPAHGDKIHDLPAKMQDYISHKQVRIQKVFSTLQRSKSDLERLGRTGRGGMTMGEIVHSMYGDVPDDVSEKALVPFLQQALVKLAEDRKVGFELSHSTEKRYFVSQRLNRTITT